MADGFEVIGVTVDADGDAAAATACLADEIAIDFPSLGAIRDRMCRAFLEGDAGACRHSAEVRLTPHEAFRGAQVPLAVPISATCGLCGGRGEIWMDRCATCEGTGTAVRHQQVSLTIPAGVRDGTRIRFSVGARSAPSTAVEVLIAIQDQPGGPRPPA
ncbi:MAG TPA: hypothetical protein VHJ77_13085 [Vicinamibacterales bacterium]|nr:hypothetical protein [Vicinamibacterales bacterium]